ncbi:MAG: phosphoribosyl-AMP cyclohydrolase [Flammeovirgaceae bacterium]
MNKKELEESLSINLQFEKRGGLLPVIVQDVESKDILMLGYANQEAWQETLNSGMATFWSTSRNEIWTKGKTSGDYLAIQAILVDCDQDAIIYQVERLGSGACHTKNSNGEARKSCFYRKLQANQLLVNLEK